MLLRALGLGAANATENTFASNEIEWLSPVLALDLKRFNRSTGLGLPG
jgi:hypothetical protein